MADTKTTAETNDTSEDDYSIKSILQSDPIIKENPRLRKHVEAIFEFTQYLLDEDDNLTKSGNLTSKAKDKLDTRILELFEQTPMEEEE